MPKDHLPTNYRLHASARNGGYVAGFQMPALKPVSILDPDGRRAVFSTEDAAYRSAGTNLCDFLNHRTRSRSSHNTIRLGGAELAFTLRSADLSPAQLAKIFGTRTDRVLKWIDGAEDIPHAVRILLALLHLPGAKELAMTTTENVTIEREAAE